MKYLILAILFLSANVFCGQSDSELVKQTCLKYIEGFYEGDTTKLIESISPQLNKFGFWKNKETSAFEPEGYMSFEQAIQYAENVKKQGRKVSSSAPKEVYILDVAQHIACVKIIAWWGIDYMLLSKSDGKWIIDQVIWEGPLEGSHLSK